MLGHDRDHHGRVFRALALVDGRRIGRVPVIELAKSIGDVAAVETDDELAVFHVDARHDAEIAVVDVLVIVVLDLHHFLAPHRMSSRTPRIAPGWPARRRLQSVHRGHKLERGRIEALVVVVRRGTEKVRNSPLEGSGFLLSRTRRVADDATEPA